MFFGNSTTENHGHSWPTHGIVDNPHEVTRDLWLERKHANEETVCGASHAELATN